MITAWALTVGIGTTATWIIVKAWPLGSARLWATGWAMMAIAALEAFWFAVYWNSVALEWASAYRREFATMSQQPSRCHQLQESQSLAKSFAFDQVRGVSASDDFALRLFPKAEGLGRIALRQSISHIDASLSGELPVASHQNQSHQPSAKFAAEESQQEITTDLGLNYHTERRATPVRWRW